MPSYKKEFQCHSKWSQLSKTIVFASVFLITVITLYVEAAATGTLDPNKVHISGVLDDPIRCWIGFVGFFIAGSIFVYVEICRRGLPLWAWRLAFAIVIAITLDLAALIRTSTNKYWHNAASATLFTSIAVLTVIWGVALYKAWQFEFRRRREKTRSTLEPSTKLTKWWIGAVVIASIYFCVLLILLVAILVDMASLGVAIAEFITVLLFIIMIGILTFYKY